MPVIIHQIIRAKRKTITLLINSEAEVIIRAPYHTPLTAIEEIVEKKEGWIREKQRIVQERNKRHSPKLFQEGESFLFMGRNFTLTFTEDVQEITVADGRLYVPQRVKKCKESIISWYKKQAQILIMERVNLYIAGTGLRYTSIKITSAKKRWGSCGSNGALNFSWRLIMCPVDVIDYVVIHEISHLKHHNHSQDFWQTVQNMMPNYKAKRKWLKENQRMMEII